MITGFKKELWRKWLHVEEITRTELSASFDEPILNRNLLLDLINNRHQSESSEQTIAAISMSGSQTYTRLAVDYGTFYIANGNVQADGQMEDKQILKTGKAAKALKTFCDDLWLDNPLDWVIQEKPIEIPATYVARGYGAWQ